MNAKVEPEVSPKPDEANMGRALAMDGAGRTAQEDGARSPSDEARGAVERSDDYLRIDVC